MNRWHIEIRPIEPETVTITGFDPVFIMFVAAMIILFVILFFLIINEKKDDELSIEDIEFYKRLNMVKCDFEGLNKTFVTTEQALKGLRKSMSIPARIVNRKEDSNFANSRNKS